MDRFANRTRRNGERGRKESPASRAVADRALARPCLLRGPLATALLLGVCVALLAGCGAKSKPSGVPAVPVMEKPAASVADQPDLLRFFCLNAITPFHHKVSSDPAVRDALWETLDKQLTLASKLGAAHIRLDMWWSVIEPEKGRFEWEFPDRVIDAIVAAGLEPYPILCYNAAWNRDASPASPEDREAFGNYVYQLVNRYKGKVRQWEVWNEPNTTPFWVPNPSAVDYAELLKIAYARAKEVDPTCTVVGFCTAGADFQFIEDVYKNGAKGSFDALSYHHYGDQRDESVLESEIRRIRAIMDRHGDAAKPIYITELGISTGPSTISKAYNEEDQASWLVKKHMIAIVEGVAEFYWFKMKDDATEMNPDGYWGVLRNNYTWKPSGRAYEHMANLLSDAWLIGRAWRITENPNRQGDVEFLLFRNSKEIFACAWVRKDGEKAAVRLPATDDAPVENYDGKTLFTAKPGADGSISIDLTNEPRFIRNLPLAVVPLAAIHFDPNPLSISPGETKTVTMSIDNPLATPLSIDLADLLKPPEKGRLSVVAPRATVEAPPKSLTRVSLSVSLPGDAPRFTAQEFIFSDPLKYSYQFRVEYAEPFAIRMAVEQEGKRGKLTTYFTNQTAQTVAGNVSWKIRDKDVGKTMPFVDLKPGATASVERKIGAALSAATFTAIVTTDGGVTGSNILEFYGQPLLTHPPTIDGDLDEWTDLPGIKLDPKDHQIRPTDRKLTADEFSGTIKVAWTKDTLYVAADVIDADPFVNPHKDTNLWRGDAMELYFGFDGPTMETHYAGHQFHLGVSAGDKGENPLVWNWNPRPIDNNRPPDGGSRMEDAVVASKRSAKGYCVEAAIPLQSLGATAEPDRFIGFDASLTDVDFVAVAGGRPDMNSNQTVLIWNGDGMGWINPSTWGVGAMLPRE